jgi:hypothetical protein
MGWAFFAGCEGVRLKMYAERSMGTLGFDRVIELCRRLV